MEFEDKVTITTAEGVTLELPLAGVGSRAIAAVLDGAIKSLMVVAIIVIFLGGTALFDSETTGGAGPSAGFFVGLAIAYVVVFAVEFVYDVLFETLASGRTPGKRWTGLRVVRVSGGPISFVPSAVRNLVRIVDSLPGAYAVGLVSVLVSSKNQRLGDMAAGTLVVRERVGPAPAPAARSVTRQPAVSSGVPPRRPAVSSGVPPRRPAPVAIDVSAVTGEELATIRAFLERRTTLETQARGRLAWELAERLKPRVGGAPAGQHPEVFLEQIAAAKTASG